MDNAEDAHASAKCTDVHGVRVHVNLTKLGAKLCDFYLTLIFIFVSISKQAKVSAFHHKLTLSICITCSRHRQLHAVV